MVAKVKDFFTHSKVDQQTSWKLFSSPLKSLLVENLSSITEKFLHLKLKVSKASQHLNIFSKGNETKNSPEVTKFRATKVLLFKEETSLI